MARLIPGRVRNEGIGFFKAGQVELLEDDGRLFQIQVVDQLVTYDLEHQLTACPCGDFVNKGYCAHLAGAEHYIKHGRDLPISLEEDLPAQPQKREDHVFASKFLAGLGRAEEGEVKYQLSVAGERSYYDSKLLWTLRIRRLPDERVYIVRDIVGFLNLLNQEGHYQIGKNYYEPLAWVYFDEASRDLLDFLNKLASSGSQTFFPDNGRRLFLPAGFFDQGLALLLKLSDFSLSLSLGLETKSVSLMPLTSEAGLFSFKVEVELDSIELQISEHFNHHFFDYAYLYKAGVFYQLTPQQQALAKAIQTLPLDSSGHRHLSLDLADQGDLVNRLADFAELGPIEAPKAFEQVDFEPEFVLDLTPAGLLTLRVRLHYGQLIIDSQEGFDHLPFTSNPRKKARLDRVLAQLGFPPGFELNRPRPQGADLYAFWENGLALLRDLGPVHLSEAVEALKTQERPSIQLSRVGGLLEVNFDFSSLAQEDVASALESLRQQDPYFITKSGQLMVFDQEVHKISKTLEALRAKQVGAGRFQMTSLAAFQVKEALADYDQANFSAELEEMAAYLADPDQFELGQLPVSAKLRGYQKHGVHWLSVLDHYGFGGVLADDMGLGKTLQAISFLSQHLEAGKRALVLAPSSLIYNWQDEFAKFYPKAKVCVVQGNKAQRDQQLDQEQQVTVTSYHSFRQDLKTYQAKPYDILILDEAQVLKNSQTKIAQALREFDVDRCFALSGTPIENRLLEIWSIFQIVLPGLFVSKSQFNQLTPKQVAKIIQPFVLRRKKEEVLTELPEVTEMVYHNEMTKEQKAIYLAQLERISQEVRQTSQADFSRKKIEILSGITRLRQICNTPGLFMDYEGESGKLLGLRELLEQLRDNGRRPLIFSQFTGMLDLVEQDLAAIGLSSYTITGATPVAQRQQLTKAFNKGSRDAFLMSLKAGGVGLNLTGADTVILLDLWWNPAVEMQAISRAHRMGQDKVVQVYRLITKGSIEEKILALQDKKRHLIKDVLEGEGDHSSLSLEDLKEILGIS